MSAKVSEIWQVYVIFFSSMHMHPPRPFEALLFQQRAKRPRIVDNLGHWELKT